MISLENYSFYIYFGYFYFYVRLNATTATTDDDLLMPQWLSLFRNSVSVKVNIVMKPQHGGKVFTNAHQSSYHLISWATSSFKISAKPMKYKKDVSQYWCDWLENSIYWHIAININQNLPGPLRLSIFKYEVHCFFNL